ncbi:unnamed protein product, partial [marine sediment metagenome]
TWNIPTRVDVRRWWDMRSIDETELRSIYHRQGYHGKDLDNYVKWTKIYVDFPDLMARYSKGWIPIEEVKHQLVEVDKMPEDRFEELLQTKIKAVQEERIAETTALTRSLIIRGAKEEKLTRDETIELLMLKNYNLWEAEYIYDIEVGAASSPETPMEYRQLVESYRHAVGLDFKEVPPELLEADRKRSDLRIKLADARSRAAPEVPELEAALEIAEVTFQNMKAGYKNGWINLEDVKAQLVTVDGMKEERFEELLQTKIKAVQEERVASTTALTRSLIIKGAKAVPPKLTREETIELLMLKNYDKWEAEYIYDIEVTGAASPETPMEYRQLVESYRHAVGLDFKEVPPELLEADRKRSDLRIKLADARSRAAPEVPELEAALEIAEVTFQNMKAG